MNASNPNQTYRAACDRFALLLEPIQAWGESPLPQDWGVWGPELKQAFGDMLATVAPDQLPQLQPFHTEINRELRLLLVGVSQWQVARQPATKQQRANQIQAVGDRLSRYCQQLVTLTQRLED